MEDTIVQYSGQPEASPLVFQDNFPVSCPNRTNTLSLLPRSLTPRHPSRLTTRGARRAAGVLTAAGILVLLHPLAMASEEGKPASAHHRVHAQARHGSARDAEPEPVALTGGSINQIGYASYYGPRHHGHRTASGGIFDQEGMTAAHPWLPFGTKVQVTDRMTGRQVTVTITDRLGTRRRIIDLSLGAARELGILTRGVASVELTAL
jgi:rare lipoprotein A